jgi:Flp pilus assembly pilin Flp
MTSLIRNERGAETLEYTILVSVLAIGGFMLFGPGGLLHQALATGVQTVADVVAGLPPTS